MPPETSIRWPVDPAIFLGKQRGDHRTDVIRLPDAAERRHVRNALIDFGIIPDHASAKICRDCAGGDGIDCDSVRTKLLRQVTTENLDRALHGCIRGASWNGDARETRC